MGSMCIPSQFTNNQPPVDPIRSFPEKAKNILRVLSVNLRAFSVKRCVTVFLMEALCQSQAYISRLTVSPPLVTC